MIFTERYKASYKQTLLLALPIVAGQLGMVLVGFFDTVQVGALGPTYMGAAGVSSSVFFQFLLLGMGILFSISPLVSEAFGEKHGWKSIGVMRSAIRLSVIISIAIYLVMLLVVQNFEVFRETPTITALAKQFLTILNYSTPLLIFFTLGKQFMDGMGRTKVSMYINVGGLILNVFLNWVLIYGKLGIPAYGMMGAAIATTISRLVMCIVLGVYIVRDKQVRELIAEYKRNVTTHKNYVGQIMQIGIPSGLQVFFEVAAFNTGIILSGWLGETSLASFQVAINLASITFMMVSGLAAAGTINVGFAFGAKDRDGIRIAGNTVYVLTIIVQLFFAVVFFAFNTELPKIYTHDAQVIATASSLLLLAALFQLGDGIQVVGVGILRGLQDTKIPSVIAFASYWVIMVPLGYYLAFNMHMGVHGIWWGFVVGLSLAALLMYLRFRAMLTKIEFVEL